MHQSLPAFFHRIKAHASAFFFSTPFLMRQLNHIISENTNSCLICTVQQFCSPSLEKRRLKAPISLLKISSEPAVLLSLSLRLVAGLLQALRVFGSFTKVVCCGYRPTTSKNASRSCTLIWGILPLTSGSASSVSLCRCQDGALRKAASEEQMPQNLWGFDLQVCIQLQHPLQI